MVIYINNSIPKKKKNSSLLIMNEKERERKEKEKKEEIGVTLLTLFFKKLVRKVIGYLMRVFLT